MDIAYVKEYVKEYDLLFLKNGTNGEIWSMDDINKKLKTPDKQYEGFEIPDGYVVKIHDNGLCHINKNLNWLICMECTKEKFNYITAYSKKDDILTDDCCIAIYGDIEICPPNNGNKSKICDNHRLS